MRRFGLFHVLALCSLGFITREDSTGFPDGQDMTGLIPILSRPTDASVTVTIVPVDSLRVYVEYGTGPSVYAHVTDTATSAAGVPLAFVLTGLSPDRRYFYRMRYRSLTATQFLAGDEHTFSTQRSRGGTFRFAVEADPHPYDKKGSHTLWPITLQNQLADSADFLIDLGDTFGDDRSPSTITNEEIRRLRLNCRPYLGIACHSSPLFLCLGNHEGESGYYLMQTPPDNIAVEGTLWRKYYYANPVPDGFYSGNTVAEGFGIGLPENYYSWEWGNALFVVLDAYRGYTASAKPRGWDWTLGKEQYDWLKRTLESSGAAFKFVFAHHVLGETRGGVTPARLYEWGGYEADAQTWGFSANRPGWPMPIHQLMVQNRVTIFFQGHDHLFAKEDLDGVIYQEVPMPSDSTYTIGVTDNGGSYTGVKIDGSGHVRVTVSPDTVLVDYVQAWLPADETTTRRNGQIAYSYAVLPTVASADREAPLRGKITLEQNYPNPFNPATLIRYQLRMRSHAILRVYDMMGREVAMLVNQVVESGAHIVSWDASGLPSGVYYYRLHASGSAETRKAVLLR